MAENDSNWDAGSILSPPKTIGDTEEKGGNQSSESESNEEKQEIPITDKEEALSFAYKELGKLMRNDGHQIELKVIGNINYRVGAWIRVFLPSFNEDCMMFISKVNHESGADSEWITSLTLVDYPPSVGKGKSNASSSSLEGIGDGTTSGGDSESEESGEENDTLLWTKLSEIVWEYYPASKNKNKWIDYLRNAKKTWSSIAKVVNKMGGNREKQDKVIGEVLNAKNRLQKGEPKGNIWDNESLPKSSAGTNSNYQRNQVTYNKNNSQYYIKNYLNNQN